ncbi:OmpA/MotB domain-containing protein [Calothrix sp. NIES-2100]|uniref:eCIS core domain-containing protein n=1 Tax=Calothrix sp. NIES-2100 TaxID=1954172 RepID=UPI000B613822|nr:OmpA/MotB domain-containing protein [Calothrix sp. NIES-2100]
MTSRQIRQINRQSQGETPLVSGILQRAAVRSIADREQVQPGILRESRFEHDFSQVPIHSGSLPNIQTDRYEQETDRVAKDEVEQIHASAFAQSTQKQSQAVQAKPESKSLKPQEESKIPNQTGLPDNLKAIRNAQSTQVTEPAAPVQPKLTIGQPNDQYEQEADRVAEQVMSMAPPATPNIQRQTEEEQEEVQTKPLVETITPIVQRQETLEEDEPIQAKCESCEKEAQVQRSPNGVPQVQADLESRLNASKGGGSPLPDEVRSFMEPRFKTDFSQVRVHTDSTAVQMNHALNAQAFTHKQDVYFGQGKAPAKDELTAHELTHVVQQGKEIRRYRNTGAFNFGKQDDATLIEDSFNVKKDKETKPWIKQITVEFDSLKTDSGGNKYSSGTASVQYHDNPVKLPDFSFTVSGGSQTLGKTGSGTFTVSRIEGIGYNSGTASGQPGVDFDLANREGPNKRYSKDLAANMSYAVFYNKGEALHAGPLNFSSHGCVHVDWTNLATIKQLNYHSVIGLTKVKVKYLSLNEAYENAIKISNWQQAAEFLNGFNRDDILARLARLRQEQIADIHKGALNNPNVGPKSQVAELTRAIYLDFNYERSKTLGNWGGAAEFLNGFNNDDILNRVKRLSSDQLSKLRQGALTSMPGWSKRVTDIIDSVATP